MLSMHDRFYFKVQMDHIGDPFVHSCFIDNATTIPQFDEHVADDILFR